MKPDTQILEAARSAAPAYAHECVGPATAGAGVTGRRKPGAASDVDRLVSLAIGLDQQNSRSVVDHDDVGVGTGRGRTELPVGLRVCMVHFSNFPVDSRVQRQARALADLGAEVDCVSVSPPQVLHQGSGVIRLHDVGIRKERSGASAYIRSYLAFFARAARKVTALHRARPFDLIQVHNMPNFLTFAGVAAKRQGTPILLDVHDTFPELFESKFGIAPGHPFHRLMRVEERLSAGYADAMMCVTDEAAARLNGRGVAKGRTLTVMNSPDERLFGPPRSPVAFPSDGELRAVYHGGLAQRFGIATMVEAFALVADRLPNLSLTICGADHDIQPVLNLVERHRARNVIVEPKPRTIGEIPSLLAESHVGIVPTLHDSFTELLLPVKLLECVHMGLPVVASRLPVLSRYFTENEVKFFTPDSARSLADSIVEVVQDPEETRAAGERARRRLASFGWEEQRDRYLGLVTQLVENRDAARRARIGG